MSFSIFGVGNSPSNGEPYDLSGHTIPFTYTWPTEPTTSNGTYNVTANSLSDLQTALNLTGYTVNIPAGTYTGDVTIGGDDLDIVMSNSATIVGDLSCESFGATTRNRVRWTGGTIDNTARTANTDNMVFRQINDFLFDDVVFLGGITFQTDTQGSNRLAFINCTIDNRHAFTQFQFFFDSGQRHSDVIVANCLMYHSAEAYQVTRFQRISNVVVVDSYLDPLQGADGSLRFGSGCDFAYIAGTASKPMNYVGRQHMSYVDNGETAAITNGTWGPNVNHYRAFNQFASNMTTNTGTVSNYTLHSGSGAEASLASLDNIVDGGGNQVLAWDGSTLPALTGYGASH